MPSFVFWNAQTNSRANLIGRLAKQYEANFVLVAEGKDAIADVLVALSKATGRTYHFAGEPDDRVKLFTTYTARLIQRLPAYDEDKVVAFRVDLPLKPPFLLAAVHLRSKLHGNDERNQAGYAREACEEIVRHEAATGIDRTVVVGDFNMDPYETGMISVDGFHALMDRRLVAKGARNVGGRSRRMFYNPMWSLLGDLSTGPPGSYFRFQNRVSPGWHLFDQVLLRPSLIPTLSALELSLIESPEFATSEGRPSRRHGSDHFPLRFVLNV